VLLLVREDILLLDLVHADLVTLDWLSNHMVAERSVVDAVQDHLLAIGLLIDLTFDLLTHGLDMVLVERGLGQHVSDDVKHLCSRCREEAYVDRGQLSPGLDGQKGTDIV
jgi:hypothetical protein